jgi:hypothetical protein
LFVEKNAASDVYKVERDENKIKKVAVFIVYNCYAVRGCLKSPVIAGLTRNPLQIVNAKLLVINY